jgi:hypothetical protein
MGDMAEVFNEMTTLKKARHARWYKENMILIERCPYKYTLKGIENVLFREPNKPMVNFYPSTGRWRLPQQNITMRGGAKAFLVWYGKQHND